MQRTPAADRTLFYFNMRDPVIGGYTPEKVALRRAIGLATDIDREIRLLRRGQAIPAQSLVAPNTWGYDPPSEREQRSRPGARKALLDLHGYLDRDGDGWRRQPDGSPLQIEYATQPDALSRQFDELWKSAMDALGVRLKIVRPMARAAEDGARRPADDLAARLHGHESRCAGRPDPALRAGRGLAEFLALQPAALRRAVPPHPGAARRPERLALLQEAIKISLAFMPLKRVVHRIITDLTQPWLTGYRRPPFGNQFWQYVDIDAARQPRPRKPRCGGATGSARRRRCLAAPGLARRRPTRVPPRQHPARRLPRRRDRFDPVAIGDENSNRVAACIFESPLTYDHLARPVTMQPLTAEALPEVADDFRSFTFRIRPGIFFADDPAFQGRPRELVAQDYVYAIKRYYDPRNNSELLYLWRNAGVLGSHRAARARPEGEEALRLRRDGRRHPRAGSLHVSRAPGEAGAALRILFAQTGLAGAIAREVVEGLRRRHRRAPGGHRALTCSPPGGAALASSLFATHTASASSRPRRRRATLRRRRSRVRWRGGACRWPNASRSA